MMLPNHLAKIYDDYQGNPHFATLRARTPFVPGEGNPWYPTVVFVGEAPGADEERFGRPFVGAAGKVLRRCAERAGFRENNWWITNVVKYRPPNNRPPSREEVDAARPYLRRELAMMLPEVVVPLGRHALQTLLPNERRGITALHGVPVSPRGGYRLYYPMLHPSFVLRGGLSEEDYQRAFDNLWSLL